MTRHPSWPALAGAFLLALPGVAGAIIESQAAPQSPISAPYEGQPVRGPSAPVAIDGVGVPNTVATPLARYERGTPPIPGLTWEEPEEREEGDGGDENERGAKYAEPFAHFSVPAPKIWSGPSNSIDTINFDSNSPTGSRFIPADPHGAAGPNHVVTVTNVTIQIHNKTTGAQLYTNTLQAFFSPGGFATPPTTTTFDPKVLYDSQNSRWLVVTLEKTASTSFIFLAVSDDNDPTGNWILTRIDAQETIAGNVCWFDYPGFAFDEEAVYISGNMFRQVGNNYCASRLFVVAKTPYYTGGTAVVSRLDPYVAAAATTGQPARILGTPPTGTTGTWITSFSGISDGTLEYVQAIRIDSPLTAPVFTVFQRSMGNIDNLGAQPDSPQSGSATLVESNDRRALDAVWSNNALWTSFTHVSNSAPDSGQPTTRWVRIATPAVTIADQGNISGETIGAGAHTTFSSIAVNSWGATVVGFSGLASNIFPSAYAVSRRATDPAGVTSNPVTIKAGVASYVRTFGGPQNRWGDYSAVATDPVDQCFWVYNKWAWTQGTIISGENGRWNTTIAKVCVCEGNEATSTDNDFDGKCADIDNCPLISNNDQANGDGDTIGNACDNCPLATNQTQLNSDADSFGDACDNCPFVTNQNQLDTDGDGIGDACDNTPPTFTPAAALSRQRGSVAGAAAAVGAVTDLQTPAGSITVTQIAGGTSTGVTASSIVNTAGAITAVVTASCTATAGTLRFQANDGTDNATGDLQVNLTNNTAPTLTYANASVAGGGSTTVNTATASDNGTITGYAVQSAGTYTGTISVNASGAVSISNAAPIGTHTITIRATDNCGATTDATFQLTVSNSAPTFAPAAAITRQRGTAASNSTVGTASDPQQAAGTLVVTQVAGGTSLGVTATGIVNTNGTITADVGAACTSTAGTLRFQASDGSLTGNGDLTVNITANAAPTLAYANANVNGGSGTTVNPSTALSDNGTATAALQAQGGYTGGISVAANGDVTLANAAPVGTHTITVRATDNCGTTTDASFQLTVNNTAPSIATSAGITRQQGTAGTTSTIATVSDPQQGAGTLTVTQVAGGTSTGMTASAITNTSGTITSTIAASCTATAGTLRFRVSDGTLTADGDLPVTITTNTAPTVSYGGTSVNGGSGTTVNPATLADNGTVTAALQSQGTYTGGISVATNGVVTITNAAPVGTHTITIRATDNCGTTTDGGFQLTVNNTAPALAAGAAVLRQQGSPGSSATIGTASDPQQAAGTLVVTQVAGGTATGITTTAVTNTNGTITATLAAACSAASGTVRFQVSDGSLTSTGDLQVNVQPNTAPVLGLYAPAFAPETGGTTVVPVGAPTDNGSVVLLTANAVQPSFTGSFSGDPVSGNVTIANAGPPGAYSVNIVAEDNCGALGNGSFGLTVTPDALFSNGFEDP